MTTHSPSSFSLSPLVTLPASLLDILYPLITHLIYSISIGPGLHNKQQQPLSLFLFFWFISLSLSRLQNK